jgi:hypothetical protein
MDRVCCPAKATCCWQHSNGLQHTLSAGYVTLVPLKNSHFDFVFLMYGPCYRFAFLCIIPATCLYNLSIQLVYTSAQTDLGLNNSDNCVVSCNSPIVSCIKRASPVSTAHCAHLGQLQDGVTKAG